MYIVYVLSESSRNIYTVCDCEVIPLPSLSFFSPFPLPSLSFPSPFLLNSLSLPSPFPLPSLSLLNKQGLLYSVNVFQH